ncbi:ORF102 [Spodoptera frugiperda granulovirus]|uniref:Ac81 n=1 Tax=Spodoptera frugiperda granulovirus TaxID=307454 RepID=A0A0C5AUX6_9BBAC|nr:ORF102 [Spodoptera frugiperda granulovirus]AJK91763.1 ORF102 [Spodoptera frugiperda granulovirus]AXS01126.1 ac81 [Spodoptera frugiperda granulovirus]
MTSRDSLVNNRIKFDPQLLLKYVFDFRIDNTDAGPNVIKICKVKVKRSCGTLLAHFYAKVYLSNNFEFEFHPGSQPKTFQTMDSSEGTVVKVLYLCDDCCKRELIDYVQGENGFNIAFRNCESILCKRKSVQTVIGVALVVLLLSNIINFNLFHMVLIAFLIALLYMTNNFMLHEPFVEPCPHFQRVVQRA